MARSDVVSRWQEVLSFAVTTTARRLRLSSDKDADENRWRPWDYVEIDNRPNASPTIVWAVNGRDATFTYATAANPTAQQPQFRIPPKEIDRVFVRATSISVIASSATTIFVVTARY